MSRPTKEQVGQALVKADLWEKSPTKPGTPGWGEEVEGLIFLAAELRALRSEFEYSDGCAAVAKVELKAENTALKAELEQAKDNRRTAYIKNGECGERLKAAWAEIGRLQYFESLPYTEMAALQSDYNAYAVLAKSVRDGLEGELAALKQELADCKSFTVSSALEAALRQELKARDRAMVEMRGHLKFMKNCDCERVNRGAKYHDLLCSVTLADKALAVNWRDFLDKEKAG